MTTHLFDTVDVIRAKRDGRELTSEEIAWVIDAYTHDHVADYQMAALNMAILLNGMTRREIADWTRAMIESGERMNFDQLSRPTADKHSTGGVGDKITLPLAPSLPCLTWPSPNCLGVDWGTLVARSTNSKRSPGGALHSPTTK